AEPHQRPRERRTAGFLRRGAAPAVRSGGGDRRARPRRRRAAAAPRRGPRVACGGRLIGVRRAAVKHNLTVLLAALLAVAALTWLITQTNIFPVMPQSYVAMWRVILASTPALLLYALGAAGFGAVALHALGRPATGVSALGA